MHFTDVPSYSFYIALLYLSGTQAERKMTLKFCFLETMWRPSLISQGTVTLNCVCVFAGPVLFNWFVRFEASNTTETCKHVGNKQWLSFKSIVVLQSMQ